MKRKVAAYIRSATKDSADRQREGLIKLAVENDYEIVQWFSDDSSTALRAADKRAEMHRLLTEAPTAEWRKIICHDRSRFTTRDALKDHDAQQRLADAGIGIHTCLDGELGFTTLNDRLCDVLTKPDDSRHPVGSLVRRLCIFLSRLRTFLTRRKATP